MYERKYEIEKKINTDREKNVTWPENLIFIIYSHWWETMQGEILIYLILFLPLLSLL